jgi:hypothetical protein
MLAYCLLFMYNASKQVVLTVNSLHNFSVVVRLIADQTVCLIKVEPGYNDIGLCDTSPIASDILCTNSSLLSITLYSSVTTTQNIQSLSRRYNRVRL